LALTAVALVTMSVVAVRLSGGDSEVTALVTVTAGDSLWSIARSVEPDGDIGSVVGAIMELNGLTASEIHPGQRLRIPVR
jgi:nucleoid-associated protein YgaU